MASAIHLFYFFFFIITTTHFLFVSAINAHNPDDFNSNHPHHIQKVAGMDDREQDESLFFIKFRTFLGLTNSNGKNEAQSPSPAPAPATHYPRPVHEVPIPIPEQDLRRRNDGGIKKILVAIIISSAFILMLSVFGLILFCHKYLKEKKTSTTTTNIIISTTQEEEGIKSVPTKMVTNQSIDLFYINSLQTSLEPHPFPLKDTHHYETFHEQIRSNSNLGRDSSSVADAEIISIHDSADSEKYESDTAEKLEPSGEAHSSDLSESFHSSSSMRLSPLPLPPPPPPPMNLTNCGYPVSSSALPPPPPPCPPPPPPLSLVKKLAYPPALGKERSRLPKLKPLHWDKVRAGPHRSTVWDKLRGSSFEFDEEMIESLFGYQLKDSNKGIIDEANCSSPNNYTKKKKHVLEAKRLHNITILSKAVNATADQVSAALLKGEGLCLQQLEALAKMTLTKEEESKLSNYKGDVNELSSAEHFVKRILNIPLAFHRIESMLYKETFDDEAALLHKSFSILQEACKELRSSRLFLKLLEAVLKTGNRMNDGTFRGGAKAFKLDALLKLSDIKGTDGRTTLLHFVVQEMIRSEGMNASESIMGKIYQKSDGKNAEEKEEDYRRMGLDLVSSLSVELHNVKKTATIDLDVLATSMRNLSDGTVKLRNLVEERLGKDEMSREFVKLMTVFLSRAEKSVKELRVDEDEVLSSVGEITEYFHGDVNKVDEQGNPLRIFVIVRDFLGTLSQVCRELRTSNSNPTNHLSTFR
ncbi:formin-like protein 11 [Impatiens glandulifera]|uniref:formin-like protein 11 n=1 Tax=Impatiens glandulifera TaxID=253017 RepID=UPI001FB0DAD2|nr:formin-like protein 11 [Impatiens glandulifera]